MPVGRKEQRIEQGAPRLRRPGTSARHPTLLWYTSSQLEIYLAIGENRKMPAQYRADHVGSFLRPAELLNARGDAADSARLRAIEDRHIRRVLAKQKELGFEIFTDGVEGFDLSDAVSRAWKAGEAKDAAVSSVTGIVNAKLRPARRLTGHELPFLRANSSGAIKMTLPSATQFPAISFKRGVTDKVYE